MDFQLGQLVFQWTRLVRKISLLSSLALSHEDETTDKQHTRCQALKRKWAWRQIELLAATNWQLLLLKYCSWQIDWFLLLFTSVLCEENGAGSSCPDDLLDYTRALIRVVLLLLDTILKRFLRGSRMLPGHETPAENIANMINVKQQ